MHYLDHRKEAAHVVIFYRNFQAHNSNYSHIGLGVNALHTAKVLRKHGIRCDVQGVWTVDDVRKGLRTFHPTHAIIEAPWISVLDTETLLNEFPHVHFIVRAHSQIGFLQVEAGAIKILRDLMVLQEMQLNLTVATNTRRLQAFMQTTYNSRCLYLPNLYDVERVHRKRQDSHNHRLVRIGSFGAMRLLKNHTTAAAAAMMIARRRNSDLEFYVNNNREENPGAKGILDSLRNLFSGLQWAKLIEVPWAEWARFRQTVAHMDLCVQTSFTETFNIVTSDAVSEGVPSVVSEAIEWVPSSWQADPDCAEEVCRVGSALLWDPNSAHEGLKALQKYVSDGVAEWLAYLNSNPT